jgi:outer membrane protein TolC
MGCKQTLLAVIVLTAGTAGAAEILTLEHAIGMALENNRSLQTSVLDIQKAQDRLGAARTRQYPGFSMYMLGAQQLRSFDFTLEKGILGNYEEIGPLPSEDVLLKTPLQPTGFFLLRASQPITSLIRIRRSMEALETGVELANEQTRAERQKIVRDVKRLYYGLQEIDSNLRSVRATRALYEEVEKLTSNYVVQQVALRGDLLDAQTRLAKTQQLEIELTNQQASGREQLNHLLGRDVSIEFEVQPVLEATGHEPGLNEARARALKERPEIRQALLRRQQAEQDLRAKKAEYIPDISAEFNNVSFLNWGRFMPAQTMSVGVSLTWEPFDWGRKKHEAAEKERTVEQARVAQLESESLVAIDVSEKYRQLQYRRAELRVARLAQETAVENLRVVKNRYGVQAALARDVLQVQAALEQSSADYQKALTSFWDARAEFERAMGENQ